MESCWRIPTHVKFFILPISCSIQVATISSSRNLPCDGLRQRCLTFAARPIASEQEQTFSARQRTVKSGSARC